MKNILVKEFRNELLENHHLGSIAIISNSHSKAGEVIYKLGDIDNYTYYRSASKPIQNLVTLKNSLHKSYNLSDEEIAILNSSHWGSKHHISTLKSICTKTNILESDLIMNPASSMSSGLIAKKLSMNKALNPLDGQSRLQHNCSGKHLSLILSNRFLSTDKEGYHLINAPVQQEILSLISTLSNTPKENIKIGTDGCGVPVFAVPLKNIALSYSHLANPTHLDSDIKEAIITNNNAINLFPEKINDFYTPIYYLNNSSDFIVKDGARGVIAIGIKSMKLGIAVKLLDGSTDEFFGLIIAKLLEELGYPNKELIKLVRNSYTNIIYNDNNIEVGRMISDFSLK